MHNIKLIRRRFPKHGDKVVAFLAGVAILALIGGVLLLTMSN